MAISLYGTYWCSDCKRAKQFFGEYRVLRTADGVGYRSWAVLLAVGSTYRRLGIPGEDDFIGSGVHFCATCDGAFYRDRAVLVIGGGNSAGEESIFLTCFASKVSIAIRLNPGAKFTKPLRGYEALNLPLVSRRVRA